MDTRRDDSEMKVWRKQGRFLTKTCVIELMMGDGSRTSCICEPGDATFESLHRQWRFRVEIIKNSLLAMFHRVVVFTHISGYLVM